MKKEIFICTGNSCSQKFSKYIIKRLNADKIFYNYPENFSIVESPCMGKCEKWPNIKIDGEIFSEQNPVKTSEIVKNFL